MADTSVGTCIREELAACDPGSAQARVDQLKANPSSASRFRLPNIRNIHSEVARLITAIPSSQKSIVAFNLASNKRHTALVHFDHDAMKYYWE
jgi:hypothetical protein